MYEPSGKSIAPWPPVPVLTVLPALRDSPGVPGLPSTVIGWLMTTSDAGAVIAADAWTTKKYQPAPPISSTMRTSTSRHPPQPKLHPKQPDRVALGGAAAGCEAICVDRAGGGL